VQHLPKGVYDRTKNKATPNKQIESVEPQSDSQPESLDYSSDERFNYANFAPNSQPWMNNGGQPLSGTGFYQNPIWMNQIIKQVSGLPQKYDRETILKYLENPIFFEKPLKDLAQYLYLNIGQFKRIIDYYAKMFTYKYYIKPINLSSEEEAKYLAEFGKKASFKPFVSSS
jgi:hypothetical protein